MSLFEPKILSVSELTKLIKQELELSGQFKDILVRGEISGVTKSSAGHYYFTLKDEKSVVPCVLFRRYWGRETLSVELKHGMKVIVSGSLTVYEPGGKYQLKVEEVFPEGLGRLHLLAEELKQRLKAEGLFDEERKRPLPPHPRKLGVVTSPSGAVIRDIVTVARRRYPNIEILLSPALVQGSQAPASIVRALADLYAQPDVDVIIVGRGGGSFEELNAFNQEEVVRAIAASPVPIVSAVGHETDFTLADLAADKRAPTPSAAAELVVPCRDELCQRVDVLRERAEVTMLRLLQNLRANLTRLRTHTYFSNPRLLIEGKIQQCDEITAKLWQLGPAKLAKNRPELSLTQRRLALAVAGLVRTARQEIQYKKQSLRISITRMIERARAAGENQAGRLDALSPLKTLARGYSVCQNQAGRVVTTSSQVELGEDLRVRLARGELGVKVMEIKGEEKP